MALDWAGHKELLENILIYITEGISNFAIVLKNNDIRQNRINSYVLRARVGKIPYRQYYNPSNEQLINSSQRIFIFSPEYEREEISYFISSAKEKGKLISVYHILEKETENKEFELFHFTNETSIDRIKTEVLNWVTRRFYPNLWGKSVWTYNYSVSMMNELGADYSTFVQPIYDELSNHFCKKGTVDGSYDNVTNATCNMLEIIYKLSSYNDLIHIPSNSSIVSLQWLKEKTELWLEKAISNENCNMFDRLYILVAFYRIGYFNSLAQSKKTNINNTAYHLIISHENEGFETRSNLVLCQILFIIKELFKNGTMPKLKASEYSMRVIRLLAKRQNEFGQWGNMSETSEVLLNILKVQEDKIVDGNSIIESNETTEIILLAVEYLFQSYDRKSCSWYEDINTTVKAIHAVCLFDRVMNYSANDFFHNIVNEHDLLNDYRIINQDTINVKKYIEAVYEKEKTIKELRKKNNKMKYYKNLFWISLVSTFSALMLVILIFVILSNETIKYSDDETSVLSMLFDDWKSELMFGFISMIVGTVISGAYSFAKRKVIK